MKIKDLTHQQLEKIFDVKPEWVAANKPEWIAATSPEWMAANRPQWTAINQIGKEVPKDILALL